MVNRPHDWGDLFVPNCSLAFASLAQRDAITHEPHSAIHVAAAFGIIDAIAVANVEAALGCSTARPRTGRTGERSPERPD